ncbi:MAG: hypothetical protein KGJ90_06265 [Patescibacteria group bacterium]|nr:hypothetical protein [Patescibacteria group bacterium]
MVYKSSSLVAGFEPAILPGTTSQYWRGDKTWQTLDKTAVGLANVDNTSDLNKPISTATQTALNAKEPTIVAGTTAQYWRGDKTWQTFVHASLSGLSADDHTQYALLAGRAGGQTLIGGTAASNTLVLQSTSNSTKGYVQVQNDGFYVSGTYVGTVNIPFSGGRSTMFFDPVSAAFRAGYVTGTQWNTANVGAYSIAMGRNTIASNSGTVAIGNSVTTSGSSAVGLGLLNNITGGGAVGIGSNLTVSGAVAVSVGNNCTSSNDYTVTIGYGCSATSLQSSAIGFFAKATGLSSVSLGFSLSDLDGSYAFGSGIVAANGDAQTKTMVLLTATGDATPTVLDMGTGGTHVYCQLLNPYSAMTARYVAVAHQVGTATNKAYEGSFLLSKGANNAATTLTVLTAQTSAGSLGGSLAVTADTTNGAAKFTATGVAATVINWVVTIFNAETFG